MDQKRGYRSLFWPVILIGVGLIWLLHTLGFIPLANINALLSLWPLILIVIGLDLLIGRRSAVASALIALATVAIVVFVLLAAPALNLPTAGNVQSRLINEPLGQVTSADISLDLSFQPSHIYALNDSLTLFLGKIDYYGKLDYSAEGTSNRTLRLKQVAENIPFTLTSNFDARWEIGLSPAVPIDLSIDGGSGSANIDLTGLQLTTLNFDQGSGSFDVTLPMSPQTYEVTAVGGSGSLDIALPEQTSLTLRLDGQSGSLRLRLPANAGVRLEVQNSGSGGVNFPASLELVSGGADKEGVWQTPGYESAPYQLEIICEDLGSGSFNLR